MRVRRASPRARQLRRDMTDAESKLWEALRDRRLLGWKIRRQVEIKPYYVDFLCVEAKLVIEVDGGQHNADVDAARTAFLEKTGLRVIRFWNNDVLANLDVVLLTIAEALGGAAPSSNLR
jgi:very-short-patch-repair endonuclease